MTTATTTRQQTADNTASLIDHLMQDPDVLDVWAEATASIYGGERTDLGVFCVDLSTIGIEYVSDKAALRRESTKRHGPRGEYKMFDWLALACELGVVESYEAEKMGRGLYALDGSVWRELVKPQPNPAIAEHRTRAVVSKRLAWWLRSIRTGDAPLARRPGPSINGRERTPVQSNLDAIAKKIVDGGGFPMKLSKLKRDMGIFESQPSLRRSIENDDRFIYDGGSVRLAVTT